MQIGPLLLKVVELVLQLRVVVVQLLVEALQLLLPLQIKPTIPLLENDPTQM